MQNGQEILQDRLLKGYTYEFHLLIRHVWHAHEKVKLIFVKFQVLLLYWCQQFFHFQGQCPD